MVSNFEEGEKIAIPCRKCASVSIEMTVRSGSHVARCSRCNEVTRVAIRRNADGWSISQEFDASTRAE